MHVVVFVAWSSGEELMKVGTTAPPYVPQLKSTLKIGDAHYLVAVVDSECREGLWRVTVKLARA